MAARWNSSRMPNESEFCPRGEEDGNRRGRRQGRRGGTDSLKAIKTRHTAEVAPLCTAHGKHVAEKEDIDKRKAAVRKQLDDHTVSVVKPYERRINELLDTFNAGFTIAEDEPQLSWRDCDFELSARHQQDGDQHR